MLALAKFPVLEKATYNGVGRCLYFCNGKSICKGKIHLQPLTICGSMIFDTEDYIKPDPKATSKC